MEKFIIAFKPLIANNKQNHWGIQNACKTHTPDEYIRSLFKSRNWPGIESDIGLVGSARWRAGLGLGGHTARVTQADGPQRDEHRVDLALRHSEAAQAMDLRGIGLPRIGLGDSSGVCAFAKWAESDGFCLAGCDWPDSRYNVGADQSGIGKRCVVSTPRNIQTGAD